MIKGKYSEELFFVLGNGMEVSLDFIQQKLQESVDCGINKSTHIFNTKMIMFFIGTFIMILSIGYMIYFIISLTKKINEL